MNTETKQVKLLLENQVIDLEGSPEELVEQIQVLTNKEMGNVIQFPLRGIFAHPSAQEKNRG